MTSLALAKTIPLSRASIFDGIVLYEPIDAALLNKCINCDLLSDKYDDPLKTKYFENEKTHLENYSRNINKNLARVEYKRTKGYDIGRFNPSGSLGLHSIRKSTRHTLVNGLMRDIDIENAHNQFLVQILAYNKYDGEYDMLIDYCDKRDKWRTEIINAWDLKNNKYAKLKPTEKSYATPKEIAKNLVIRLLYGGSVDKWLNAWGIEGGTCPSKIQVLVTQISQIQLWICENNPDLYELCKKKNNEKKKDYNHAGTTAAWFLQEKECIVLETMYKFLLEKECIKNDICSLCNDGIMIEDKYYYPELLEELNVAVLKETGFNLKFVEKPLTDGYEDIIDKHLIFDLWKKQITDGLYADYFKMLYYKDFCYRHGFLYTYNGVYWEKDENKKLIPLSSRIDNQFRTHIIKSAFNVRKKIVADRETYTENKFLDKKDKKMDKDAVLVMLYDKWSPRIDIPDSCEDKVLYLLDKLISAVNGYIGSIDDYLRQVKTRDKLVKDCCRVLNSDWVEFDANEYLLAFENKIYNLEVGKWINPRYDQYISFTTGWKWVNGYNSRYKEELQRLLKQIFPQKDIRDIYLEILSTGLYGKTIQHFFVAKGVGGNGKSVINSLMMKCVGNYGYKLPSSAVSQTIKEGANPAIANLNNKRFVLFQEPDKAKKICCSTIKEMTGDKELNCRTLYSTDTLTRLKLSLLGEFNDLPALDESGDAISRRLMVIAFVSMFLTQNRYDMLTDEEKASGKYFLANPYYTSDAFQDQFKQALMEILMDSFKTFQKRNYIFHQPKAVVKEAEEYMKYSDDLFGWFSDKFIKDEKSITPFKEVWDKFSDSSYYNNMNKQEKRRYNQKLLKSNLCNNQFLKDIFKKKGCSYKGKPVTADSIVGWRAKSWNDDDNGDVIDEDKDEDVESEDDTTIETESN